MVDAIAWGVLLGPKPSSGIQYGLIGGLESTVWMKYDLLDGRWERRVASAVPARLHDDIGTTEKEATDEDSQA